MTEANYYDGKSSKPRLAQVQLGDKQLILSIIIDGQLEQKHWDFEKIHPESFSNSNYVTLQYGDEFPQEKIELKGEEGFSIAKEILQGKNKIRLIENLIVQAKPLKVVLIGLLFLICFVLSYVFYISPFIGDQTVKLLPKSVEKKVGNIVYENMEFIIDEDEEISSLLQEFYQACGFASDYKVEVTYSSNNMVNAFALPGGRIVVFEGIIDELETWEQLASLLAHELAHVNKRHSFKSIARSMSAYLIVSALTGDVAGGSTIIIEQASQINNLSNSRKFEKEAYITGLHYLLDLNIKAESMIELFQILQNESETDLSTTLRYLSIHPLSESRMDYLHEIIDSNPDFEYLPIENEKAKELFQLLKAETCD